MPDKITTITTPTTTLNAPVINTPTPLDKDNLPTGTIVDPKANILPGGGPKI